MLKKKYFQRQEIEEEEEPEESRPIISREDQMKLIDQRARENHERERYINGLVIKEAYYGDSFLIEKLATVESNKAAWLFR